MDYLEFIETTPFSKQREHLLDDGSFAELQDYLLKRHVDGDVIRHTGGCQKIRWHLPGTGKRGGIRVVYYGVSAKGRIYLLAVYAKNSKADLSDREKAILKSITERLEVSL